MAKKKNGKNGKNGKKGKGKGRKSKKGKSVSSVAKVPSAIIAPIAAPPPPPPKKRDPCDFDDVELIKGVITCRPNRYPGLLEEPEKMAVVGSECGSYDSLCKLLRAGFRCADRVFTMTPWGNYVVYRVADECKTSYFIYDGCTCNVNRFRYLDLRIGTAGLLYFADIHALINYIKDSRDKRLSVLRLRRTIIDDICREFCEYGYQR